MEGRQHGSVSNSRTALDWLLILGTTAMFIALATIARLPSMEIGMNWAVALTVTMLVLMGACGVALWRTTRFR